MPAARSRARSGSVASSSPTRSLAILHRGDEELARARARPRVAAAVADRRLGAAVHFWAAVHWGLWGETKGSLAAVRKGIAKRIRDHALAAIALDETFERGGPHRLLGRLHAVAPRVPLFTGWVSHDEALRQLERAIEIAPADLANRLYLGRGPARDPAEQREQALREIEAVIAAEPAADIWSRTGATQADARAALDRARDG